MTRDLDFEAAVDELEERFRNFPLPGIGIEVLHPNHPDEIIKNKLLMAEKRVREFNAEMSELLDIETCSKLSVYRFQGGNTMPIANAADILGWVGYNNSGVGWYTSGNDEAEVVVFFTEEEEEDD